MSNGSDGIFERVFYDPKNPASYSSVEKLQKATKKKRAVVETFLQGEQAYTLHKARRQPRKRNRVFVTAPFEQLCIDLTDFTSIKSQNRNLSWILVAVDAFSKYSWVECLARKTAQCVLDGLKAILDRMPRKPASILADNGGEFGGAPVQNYLKKEGIAFYTVKNSDTKVTIVERFQLTLKTKLFKAFTKNKSYRYCDGLLDDIVEGLNHSYHRSIRMRPADVTDDNVLEVTRNLYGFPREERSIKPKLNVGDYCRIQRELGRFEKPMYGAWTTEVFRITHVIPQKIPLYRIAMLSGEPIIGNFYAAELQKINPPIENK